MKIVTFNIRCDYEQDEINNFCFRKPLILKKLQKEKPDIVCFQEVLPHVAVWLKEQLTDYYLIGCGRSEDLYGEQVTIAYRRNRMNLISMDTYWLSDTPNVPGSRYEDQSICPRVCTEALFEDLETKQVFRIANTHLDHEGTGARKEGLRQILMHLQEQKLFANAPVIITGDMNAEPNAEEMKVIKEYPEYVNATEGIGTTFHAYGKEKDFSSIDYIFLKGLQKKEMGRWMDKENGVYLSDHYPVWIEI